MSIEYVHLDFGVDFLYLPISLLGIFLCKIKLKFMVTKQEFDLASKSAPSNLMAFLPKMISYKSYIQKAVLDIASRQELQDVCDSRINQGMIDKLCKLAKNEWLLSGDAQSLYCAAMSVATIVKEYDWGTQYLVGNGLFEMAQRIQNT